MLFISGSLSISLDLEDMLASTTRRIGGCRRDARHFLPIYFISGARSLLYLVCCSLRSF